MSASSLPALTAAKCAERQGAPAFERLHQRLFTAHFQANLDISRLDVLRRLARESGLDMGRFQRDVAAGEAYDAVLHDYAEGVAWFGVSALPTVIFNEQVSPVGAAPEEHYRLLLDWMLAGEPGGLLAPPCGGQTSDTLEPRSGEGARRHPVYGPSFPN